VEATRIAIPQKATREKQPPAVPAVRETPLPRPPARKINFLPYGIGAAVLLVIIGGIFGVNYIIKHWPAMAIISSTNTSTPTVTITPTHILMPTGTATPTHIPSPTPTLPSGAKIGSTWTRPADGMVMVYVPAGEFIMGVNSSKVPLDAFWIDQTEVTNRMYGLCVKTGVCAPPYNIKSSTRAYYYGNMVYDDFPVIYVSWSNANKYCEWVGAELPTEAEWEKAARGADGRVYPWGAQIDCTRANYDDAKKMCVGDTSPVGSYESGKSPYGAYDMSGNVMEWVSDLYSVGTSNVLKGGSWLSSAAVSRPDSRNYLGVGVSTNDYIGFRCSRTP
jgi:formylglycine-generating enzyme required for sulfatase activity